jgi:hypothetical protein
MMKGPLILTFAVATLAIALRANDASAQVAETTVDSSTLSTGPSMEMVGSGIATFTLSYLPAVVVGATSDLDADRALFVPLAGPWLDLTARPHCGEVTSCGAEDTAKVLLVTDGVFQAIGAVTILGGFLTTTRQTTTVRAASARPALRIGPGSVGARGYGLLALGTF